jgi:hypothetical protein
MQFPGDAHAQCGRNYTADVAQRNALGCAASSRRTRPSSAAGAIRQVADEARLTPTRAWSSPPSRRCRHRRTRRENTQARRQASARVLCRQRPDRRAAGRDGRRTRRLPHRLHARSIVVSPHLHRICNDYLGRPLIPLAVTTIATARVAACRSHQSFAQQTNLIGFEPFAW